MDEKKPALGGLLLMAFGRQYLVLAVDGVWTTPFTNITDAAWLSPLKTLTLAHVHTSLPLVMSF